MKKLFSLLLCVIILGIFSGCKGIDAYAPKGHVKISDDNAGYSLYVPDNWIKDLSTGVTTAYVSESDRSNISFMAFEVDTSIIQAVIGKGDSSESTETVPEETHDSVLEAITTEASTDSATDSTTDSTTEDSNEKPEITTAEEYWEYYSKEFEKTFSDMEYVIKGEDMLLSKKAAKKYVYTATVTGEEYKFMQVVMLNAGTVYIFTYTATVENYDTHLSEVEGIIGYISIDS